MNTDFYLEKLTRVVGAKVTGLVRSGKDDGLDEFYGLSLVADDGQKFTLWLLCDDEGNGPGSFDLEPMK